MPVGIALPKKLTIDVGMKADDEHFSRAYGRSPQIARRAKDGRKQGVRWRLALFQRKTKNLLAFHGNDFAERLQQFQCPNAIKLFFARIHNAGGGHLFLHKKLLRFLQVTQLGR